MRTVVKEPAQFGESLGQASSRGSFYAEVDLGSDVFNFNCQNLSNVGVKKHEHRCRVLQSKTHLRNLNRAALLHPALRDLAQWARLPHGQEGTGRTLKQEL